MNEKNLLGWLAGFLDGEGCLTISKQIRKNRPSVTYRPFITIANTNKESLEVFLKRYGGTLRFNKEKRQSKSGVPWSDSWTWYCKQSSVSLLISELVEILIVKKRQAEILQWFLLDVEIAQRKKGGRRKNGTFIGSRPLSKARIRFREKLYNLIQDCNSRKRFINRTKQLL